MVAKKTEVKVFKGKSEKPKPPIKFTVGQDKHAVEVEALGTIDGLTTLKFAKGTSSEDTSEILAAVELYLDKSFDTENRKKFEKAVAVPENGIELDDIMEIFSWLATERSGAEDLADSSE
jgi:hypothetical protein